jgi:predicted nucleic acid-binding protein
MGPLRVYMDTSVLGGCFDDEFAGPSRAFFDEVSAGKIVPLLSATLLREAEDAPEEVRDLLAETLQVPCERIDVTTEMVDLRDAYVKAKVVTARYADDALHVAQATLAQADVIASWNFKHLVNPARIRGFNEVNAAQGHAQVVILTPADIVGLLENIQ